jgi:hypothetical protein
MPKILSGAVLQTGSSSSFITLSEAQPALQITPSTATGFTLIVNTSSNVEYSNILGDITFDAGSLTNYTSYQDIAIYNVGNGYFQVYTSTFLNSPSLVTDSTNSFGTTQGAFTVAGGAGIGKNLWVGGYTNISANIASTGTQTGSLIIQGGAGISGDIYLGGNLIFTNAKQGTLTAAKITVIGTFTSTSTTTGAITVAGGLGVQGNVYAGNIYDNGRRVISSLIAGKGIAVSTSTGPTVVVTNTGVTSINAGTGTVISSTSGDVTIWINPSVTNQTLQQVTNAGNNTTNAIYFNNPTNAVSTLTGGAIFAGGVSIARDVYIGGNINAKSLNVTNAIDSTISANNGVFRTLVVTSTNYSTTTFTSNALYVAGGVGVGTDLAVAGDAVIYGNLFVAGTYTSVIYETTAIARSVIALSTASGPAVLTNGSGITVGPPSGIYASLLFDGVSAWKSMASVEPSVDLGYNLGTSGLRWGTVYAGNAVFSSGANSINPQTGALVVQGGVGISGNSVIGGQTLISNGTPSSSTGTGALVVQGGVGVAGNIYAGNIYSNGVLLTAGGGGGGTGSGVVTLFAGTDTAISTGTLGTTIWNTSNLQSITDKGNTTVNPIVITNGNNSNDQNSGALIVYGGVGIGENIFVGGSSILNGQATSILSTNTYISDNIVDLHYNVNDWDHDDGKDIGFKFDHYASTATSGFLGRADSTGHLVWYSTGTETPSGTFVGSFGVFETGVLQLNNTGTSIYSQGGMSVNGSVKIFNSATITGTIYAGPIYSQGAPILTSANLSSFGVADIIAGTGTSVSTQTGNVTIWNSANLQIVTGNGNTTNNPIIITNTTPSVSTQTGALIVSGGAAIQKSLYVSNNITSNSLTANSANITDLLVYGETITKGLAVNSTVPFPISVSGSYSTTGSVFVSNSNTGTDAHTGYILQNDVHSFVELGINSSGRTFGHYSTGSGYLYTSPSLPSLNIGNNSVINFYTQDITSPNPAAMSIGSTTTTIINNLFIEDNFYSNHPSAGLIVQSNANSSYGSFTIRNANIDGQSYTFDVGGNNRAGQGGAAINEGSLTLRDDVANAYRFIVAKGTGNILINKSVDDGLHNLQVNGGIISNNLVVTTSATIAQSLTVGVTTFNGLITVNTSSVFNGYAVFNGSATFNGPTVFSGTVVVGSSALQTSITMVNTTDPTSIDSFDSTLYRSAKSLVQIEDGNSFYMVEVVLLVDNAGTVYISQYGIITTDSPLGDFSASLVGRYVTLYFTAYEATSKRINVVQTAIGV